MSVDTLSYVKKLEAAGVTRAQAEAHAEALRDEIAPQIVTKGDLDAAVAKIDNRIGILEQKVDGRFLLLQWMLAFNLAATVTILWKLLR